MTEGLIEKQTRRDNSTDTKNTASTKRSKHKNFNRMVSAHQEVPSNSESITNMPTATKTEAREQISWASRPRPRRSSFPKRQLSRTDSTMVEMTTETVEPIILRRSSEVPDVSDIARKNNRDLEGNKSIIYERRGSGSVKKKLTRTDSTLMVVTCDPENLALKIESPSFDEDYFPKYLLEDLNETVNILHHKSDTEDIPRPSRSPPILVSEHVEARRTSVSRHQSLTGTVIQNNTNNEKQWRRERQPSLPNSSSCPNLLKGIKTLDVNFVKQKLRSTRSSDAKLSHKAKQDGRSRSASSNQLLKVPDIFTTSFQTSGQCSGSIEEMHTLELNSERKNYRHSAPELTSLLGSNGKCDSERTIVAKSLSDNPSRDRRVMLQTLSDRRIKMFQSVDHQEPPPAPFRPILGQVVEGVFMGNVESTFCERLLCKHNIGSIVDVSGCPPDAVPEHKRSNVPCACGIDSRHLQASLRLFLAEANPSELRQMLKKTNKFIDGAKNNNKGVLVNCYYGNHWSALVVIYYLMTTRGMNLRKAYSMVMMHRSDLELTSENKQFLQQIEKTTFEPHDQSLCFEVARDSNTALLPREAWADQSVV